MIDEPLCSPKRIWMAFRRWVWWAGDQGLDFPLWFFLRFEGRPTARERYKHKPFILKTGTPWYSKEEMWG